MRSINSGKLVKLVPPAVRLWG